MLAVARTSRACYSETGLTAWTAMMLDARAHLGRGPRALSRGGARAGGAELPERRVPGTSSKELYEYLGVVAARMGARSVAQRNLNVGMR